MTLGEKIAYYRKEMGISQEALGEKLGVSRQAVYKWEADLSLPDTHNLIELSRIFGVDLNMLVNNEVSKPLANNGIKASYNKIIIALTVAIVVQFLGLVWLANKTSVLSDDLSTLTSFYHYLSSSNNQQNQDEIYEVFNDYSITVSRLDYENDEIELLYSFSFKDEPKDMVFKLLANGNASILEKNDEHGYEGILILSYANTLDVSVVLESQTSVKTLPILDVANIVYEYFFNVRVENVFIEDGFVNMYLDYRLSDYYYAPSEAIVNHSIEIKDDALVVNGTYTINRIRYEFLDANDVVVANWFYDEAVGFKELSHNSSTPITKDKFIEDEIYVIRTTITDSRGNNYSYQQPSLKFKNGNFEPLNYE